MTEETVQGVEVNLNASKASGSQEKLKKTPSRYTNELLENACKSFLEANVVDNDGKKEKASALRELANSLNTFSAVYKGKVEADLLRAKAEYNKSKALYFQTFGSLDGFLE